jgi:16S rRNA (guanine966-N2)-methyltransferase|tara:strand:- start:2553 stop:3143 length:591 start_codon:yes stop_codon:yes gene_type:complete
VAKQIKLKVAGTLRIIGGRWRGRKLTVIDSEGLRPTPSRVRETLFNWLQFSLSGANCLDLFAGTGALGLEAASRGVEKITLVEFNARTAEQLSKNCQQLGADNYQLINKDAVTFLSGDQGQYDIVFIDPPYKLEMWSEIAEHLVSQDSLSLNALIYVEYPLTAIKPLLPSKWQLIKEKKAGGVNYCLFKNTVGQTI